MHVFRFEHERKAILKKNTHRKEGLTVFTELNTGGELCKKINCLASTMRRQFPIFPLFSVALYILNMSIHIAAKQGEIADKILLPGDPLRAKFIAENFLEDAVCFNEVRNMVWLHGYLQRSSCICHGYWNGDAIHLYLCS